MNKKLLGTAFLAPTVTLLGSLMTGCAILESVKVPRFDSNSYVVQPGDTLESVASRYRIDPDSLKSINSLELAELQPGQRIRLVRGRDALVVNNPSLQGGSAIGQPVAIPNATQTTAAQTPSAPATVRPISESQPIDTDLIVVPTSSEEIVKVVNAPSAQPLDELLDDQPIFTPEVDRPEGIETVVQSVDASRIDQSIAVANTPIPTAGSVSILDSDVNTPVKRITVNRHADGWNWPAIGEITKGFDLKEINRQGLDIDPGPGAGVQAAADGEVVYSGRDLASYGNLVILRHEGNFLSAYSKVNDIFVKENQKVKAGDLIASVGGGPTDSTELHFEIRRNGEPVNPVDYLPAL